MNGSIFKHIVITILCLSKSYYLYSKNVTNKEKTNNNNSNNVVKNDNVKNINNKSEKKIKKIENVNTKISTEDLKDLERAGNSLKKKKVNHLSDLMVLDDDEFKDVFEDEDILFSQGNKIPSLSDLIPISVNTYVHLLDYNLAKPKGKDFFHKPLSGFKMSYVVSYKLQTLHKKLWNKCLDKKPENKALIYIRDHFDPKFGLYFEKNSYSNYYPFRIKDKNDDNKKDYKDTEVSISIPILRLGLILQLTWTKDESGMINSTLMFSVGWQTNFYKNGCSMFHRKDIWLHSDSNFYGLDNNGISHNAILCKEFKLKSYYLMFHIDFGFYFIKIFTRFYSPIGNKNVHSFKYLERYYSDKIDIKDKKLDSKLSKESSKKFNFDNWTMTWGISLSL